MDTKEDFLVFKPKKKHINNNQNCTISLIPENFNNISEQLNITNITHDSGHENDISFDRDNTLININLNNYKTEQLIYHYWIKFDRLHYCRSMLVIHFDHKAPTEESIHAEIKINTDDFLACNSLISEKLNYFNQDNHLNLPKEEAIQQNAMTNHTDDEDKQFLKYKETLIKAIDRLGALETLPETEDNNRFNNANDQNIKEDYKTQDHLQSVSNELPFLLDTEKPNTNLQNQQTALEQSIQSKLAVQEDKTEPKQTTGFHFEGLDDLESTEHNHYSQSEPVDDNQKKIESMIDYNQLVRPHQKEKLQQQLADLDYALEQVNHLIGNRLTIKLNNHQQHKAIEATTKNHTDLKTQPDNQFTLNLPKVDFYLFSLNDFSSITGLSFHEINTIKILSLPSTGRLVLNNNMVSLGETINKTQIIKGLFLFTNTQDSHHSETSLQNHFYFEIS